MILHPVVIGIDVSKHHLDLFEEGGGSHRLANPPEALPAWSAGLAPTTPFVVFEATGSYDAAFVKALRQAGKPPKLALIALARKILVILTALIRDNPSFKPS